MNPVASATSGLEDFPVPVKLKLSALWTALMFCYVYGDFFGLFQSGKLAGMLAGKIEPLGPATQGVLLGVTISMAIPSVMVFLSLALPPPASRWANIIVAAIYTFFVALTMPGAWVFYLFLSALEMILTAAIVWHAWRWPRLRA